MTGAGRLALTPVVVAQGQIGRRMEERLLPPAESPAAPRLRRRKRALALLGIDDRRVFTLSDRSPLHLGAQLSRRICSSCRADMRAMA